MFCSAWLHSCSNLPAPAFHVLEHQEWTDRQTLAHNPVVESLATVCQCFPICKTECGSVRLNRMGIH